MRITFRDRTDAGRQLAERLEGYRGEPGLLVVALPRGGVPVAYEVARHLRAPLDVFMVRKLGVPGHEELAMGAIASGGVRALNSSLVKSIGISEAAINAVAEREQQELERRERAYRGGRPPQDFHGRTVILVDDGIATGSTVYAAIEALRRHGAERIIVGVPTIAGSTYEEMRGVVDDLAAVVAPKDFLGVGQFYRDFTQTTDEEVRRLLMEARALPGAPTNSTGR